IDAFVPAEGDDRRMVRHVQLDQFCFLRHARIARRGVERGQQWRRGELPGERMLAAAGTEEKNVHAMEPHGCFPRGPTRYGAGRVRSSSANAQAGQITFLTPPAAAAKPA